eukprot:CAMPEP_0170553500 /NCGR_PEP_ID=MMETSP0211-20121228/11325_1 /TAXON_ID=311385 /ORGANISM="Pseudokeronopsis sp., Strain OXSARD2" /LENGTH=71 /DNA_ID=CAMNT_0010861877 /DNA_START=1016 /DNA_END=1232 /DNA_ORIENTATION=+
MEGPNESNSIISDAGKQPGSEFEISPEKIKRMKNFFKGEKSDVSTQQITSKKPAGHQVVPFNSFPTVDSIP